MAIRNDRALLRQLDTLFHLGATRELTDGQLLERFARGTSEIAELAFAALVERHGPMVLRVCRAQLDDRHDTQDAFQATFLVLVKKARTLWVRDSLGPWLYQVAQRTASCARSDAARRRRHERRAAERGLSPCGEGDRTTAERERILHQEIDRLPECYRVAIVLCDLQGHTCEEAARRMGRPVGSVKCWRSRGRARLRDRLTRLGLAPAAGLGAVLAVDNARGAVTTSEAEQTVRLAVRALSGGMTAGEVSASVLALVKGVLEIMLLSKLRTMVIAASAMLLLAAGVWAVAGAGGENAKGTSEPVPGEPPRAVLSQKVPPPIETSGQTTETWSLSLHQAIFIGLDNAEGIRLVQLAGKDGTPYRVMPVGTFDGPRFRTELMARVGAIEQQYWSLAQQHAQQSAAEKAVAIAEDVVKHEEAERDAGRGNPADVAEARVRLDQFKLDLMTKTSDVITTERRPRELLGLPPADGRRIVPITPPLETRRKLSWEKSEAAMLENHPEVLEASARLKAVETAKVAKDSPSQQAQQRALLRHVIDQSRRTLGRFFQEIDTNFKQFQTASRLRLAAAQRLDAQRVFYEEGRITIDRYLDAVSQAASAVAQEAQFRTTYNIAIAALEQAQGTLLEHDHIAVVDAPRPVEASNSSIARSAPPAGAGSPIVAVEPVSSPPPAPAPAPAPQPSGDSRDASAPRAGQEAPKNQPAGTTYSFHLSVGVGSRPVEIRGSFTITPAASGDEPKSH